MHLRLLPHILAGEHLDAQWLDQTFGAKFITDVSATYRLRGTTGITLGVDNAFNVTPDRNIAINTVGGTKPYSEYAPYGQNGRFLFTRLSYAP